MTSKTSVTKQKKDHGDTDLINLEAYKAARETRNLEISLFWQRSNYFLVLSTAIAAGFFSLKEPRYGLPLAVFGALVGVLWILVNLGSKFWQSRWEHRLRIVEEQLRPKMDLFSASWETIQDDVNSSLNSRKRGMLHDAYCWLVLLKPSVTMMMTLLSVFFVGFWLWVIVLTIGGSLPHVPPDASGTGARRDQPAQNGKAAKSSKDVNPTVQQ